MATTYKVLAQSYPAAATLTDAYTVPGGVNAILSRAIVCNLTAIATKFRLAIAPLGAASANQHFLFLDQDIGPTETLAVAIGAGLAATDKVRVYSTLQGCAFTLCGVEIA